MENWEKALHDHYSPFGVIQEVILHLIMDGLEDHETLSKELLEVTKVEEATMAERNGEGQRVQAQVASLSSARGILGS